MSEQFEKLKLSERLVWARERDNEGILKEEGKEVCSRQVMDREIGEP